MSDLLELYKTNPELFPKNVAITLDGNRRWTESHNLPEIAGHRISIENMKGVIERARDLGVKTITFWVFSTENFKRKKEFLDAIFSLAREYLQSGKYFEEIKKMGGKLGLVGDLSLFPKDIADKCREYIAKSQPENSVINVNYAFGYGGRDEIVRAIKKIIKDGLKESEVTEEVFNKYLDMTENVELMIRTGRHQRTSGLYPWQATYSELYFPDILCPDFNVAEFEKAVEYFTQCVRNFGR